MITVTKLTLGQTPLGVTLVGGTYVVTDTGSGQRGFRYLSPVTGDYVTLDGELILRSSAIQRVVALLKTGYGSSQAMRGRRDPEHIGDGTAEFVKREVMTALAPVIDDGTIRVDSLTVDTYADNVPGRISHKLRFTDLLTNAEEELSF